MINIIDTLYLMCDVFNIIPIGECYKDIKGLYNLIHNVSNLIVSRILNTNQSKLLFNSYLKNKIQDKW